MLDNIAGTDGIGLDFHGTTIVEGRDQGAEPSRLPK
jgi:hypothetical protein